MENLVAELKQKMSFKNTTNISDIVLIAAIDPTLLVYALVLCIERDKTRKDEWWHVTMSLLTVPPQEVTWTLRTPQMTGDEIFTMGGQGRFMKAVNFIFTNPKPLSIIKAHMDKGGGLKRVK